MPQEHTTTIDLSLVQNLILDILSQSLDEQSFFWAKEKFDKLQNEWDRTSFHLSFGMTSRKIPREKPIYQEEKRKEAEAIGKGWRPQLNTLDTLYRGLLLTTFVPESEEQAQSFLWDAFDTADMWEQISIFSILPVLPFPTAYVKLAAEGLRTNMAPVFDAVALDNPYPATHFSQDAWNQMYLKAAFVVRPIYRIQSIAERANEKLSRIILDYAEERWSAGREVSPGFWQASTNFLSEDHVKALRKLADHEEEMHRAVVQLIREENPQAELMDLELSLTQDWTWESLGESYHNQ